MMRPQSRDSDIDEPSEDALLEAEHARMQRSYRVMQNDYKAYREETKRLINKQKSLITSLERERVELNTELSKMETTQNLDMDSYNTRRLVELATEEKDYLSLIREERESNRLLDSKISTMEKKISEQRQKMGGVHNGTIKTIATHKKKAVLENRLDKAMVHFNKQLTINRHLREDIDHLRRERQVFENLYKKLSKELDNCKSEMRDVIESSTQAFEQRDEAQNKMAALRERNEKDQQQHNSEVKDLLRIISHDDKVKEFMNIKNSDRADFISEEMAKRNRNGTDDDKGINAEIETIRVYEEAFNRIKEVTGEDNIETIVEDFIKNEDENFALFNYVNELNSEVETLQEEVLAIRKDIAAYKLEDKEEDDKRHSLMKQLERKYDKTVKETGQAEDKLRRSNKMLEELRVGIETMFKRIGCDPRPIREMLGGECGVNNKNIMIYLGQIEQRTTELLNVLHYTRMKKAEIEGHTAHSTGDTKPMPDNMDIQILAPTTWDAGDSEEEDDDDPRPLSEQELRDKVLRTLVRRSQHPGHHHHPPGGTQAATPGGTTGKKTGGKGSAAAGKLGKLPAVKIVPPSGY